jgi:hypothetical protein
MGYIDYMSYMIEADEALKRRGAGRGGVNELTLDLNLKA